VTSLQPTTSTPCFIPWRYIFTITDSGPRVERASVAERPVALSPEGTGAVKCAGISRSTQSRLIPMRSVL
jgi:hypothetical protein